MKRIIGIGETVLDIIFKNDAPVAAVPGGSTFNAMISLGRTLGKALPECGIRMVTEVGDDHIGDIVVSFMEENGVSSESVTRNRNTQSHISLAFLDGNNDAHYEFYKDHAHAGLSADKVSGITFGKDDIVLFGSFFAINPVIRSSTRSLLTSARQAGAILYYDINFRPSHVKDIPDTMDNIIENCRLADFVRGSADDFGCLYGTDDGREIYDRYISSLCDNFIMTRGAAPVEVYMKDGVLSFPVEQTQTVSTVGAGDNFNAGFIYSLATGNVGRERCSSLSSEEWKRMLAVATQFSAAACRSSFNYVDRDFTVL